MKAEKLDVEIPSHSLIRDARSSESDESDGDIRNLPRGCTEDPEWTPGSSFMQKKLQSSNTADNIMYRLRSIQVGRSGRETETDKGRKAVVGSPESEHTGSVPENMSPGKVKPAKSHSYNLRSRIESTCAEIQE